MPVIGFLHSGSAAAFPQQLAAFRQGLQDGGFIEGRNLAIEFRWANSQFDKLPALAAELARRPVAAIATFGGPAAALAGKNATTTIPVVVTTGADPVKMGLVSNLARPEGNVTGVSFFVEELGTKQLGLLREIVPGAHTIGLLVNPANPEVPRQSADALDAARMLGLQLEILKAATPDEIDQAFAQFSERRASAVLLSADVLFGNRLDQLVALAARHRLPTMYYRREFVEAGGLVSYGTNALDAYRQNGVYVARILKGAKPADLPVIQSTRFEFIINLKTARALGLQVPGTLSARADEVIE
jgi:putative ABC transport system substrate-binding protein